MDQSWWTPLQHNWMPSVISHTESTMRKARCGVMAATYVPAKAPKTPPITSLSQNRQIIVARAELEATTDERQAQAKEQIRSHHPRGRKRGEPQQRQRSNGARASRRKSDFRADGQRDCGQPARPIPATAGARGTHPDPVEICSRHDHHGRSQSGVQDSLRTVGVEFRQNERSGKHTWNSAGQQVTQYLDSPPVCDKSAWEQPVSSPPH